MQDFTQELQKHRSLSEAQVKRAVELLVDDLVALEAKAEFLAALSRKGESIEEIAVFARELRDRSIQPPIDPIVRQGPILDVCGTGGDRLNTFNISTTVAIVAASAGIAVAKHGNRAITSKSGSADVLEALGIPVNLSPADAAQSLRDHHFAFFFAPHYHPAFKQIAPARKLCAERGQSTIFNFLGPLLNPARPSVQLVGVPRPLLCEPLARVLQSLGLHRGMVVSGQVGEAWLDELSSLGPNTIAEFYQDRGFTSSVTCLEGLPIQPAKLADLTGGDSQGNAEIVRSILVGRERGPKREAVLLNAGAALFVSDRARSLLEGWEMASDLIDSGKAHAKLNELILPR